MNPALTKEEWTRHPSHQVDIAYGCVWAGLDANPPQNVMRGEVEATGDPAPWMVIDWNFTDYAAIVSRRHALAALALYGQPFGFTRDHVTVLRHMAKWTDMDDVFAREENLHWEPTAVLSSLADRIEALLPPEE